MDPELEQLKQKLEELDTNENLKRTKHELIKRIGEERYYQLYQEIKDFYRADEKRLRDGISHTCGSYPKRPCAGCMRVFPLRSIPTLTDSVQ